MYVRVNPQWPCMYTDAAVAFINYTTIGFRTHRSVTFRFGNGQQREADPIGDQCGNFPPLVLFLFFYMFNFIAILYNDINTFICSERNATTIKAIFNIRIIHDGGKSGKESRNDLETTRAE